MLLSSDFIRREPLSLHETTSSQPRALSFAPVPYAEALKARLFSTIYPAKRDQSPTSVHVSQTNDDDEWLQQAKSKQDYAQSERGISGSGVGGSVEVAGAPCAVACAVEILSFAGESLMRSDYD